MTIKPITNDDEIWEIVACYADECTWSAGKNLAREMRTNSFRDWERVFVAFEDNHIVAYCTLTKTDCIPNVPYTPYIGYMFVGEQYRGRRISQKLINFVLEYAKVLHFSKVYLVSDHINLYEKYGFIKIDEKPAPWNPDINETIFMHLI